jgi:hypothetical protein
VTARAASLRHSRRPVQSTTAGKVAPAGRRCWPRAPGGGRRRCRG